MMDANLLIMTLEMTEMAEPHRDISMVKVFLAMTTITEMDTYIKATTTKRIEYRLKYVMEP